MKLKRRYGLDWPADTHDVFIDLTLGKKHRLAPFCHGDLLDPGEHWLRAIRQLFTQEEFGLHRWSEAQVHAFCNYDSIVALGSASSGKSNVFGFLAVLFWLCDPLDTYVALASTSVPMLKLRSFESVTRCFRILKKNPYFLIPGKEAPSQTAIINDGEDAAEATLKASIRGVALADGNESKAVSRLAGAHSRFSLLLLDEGSALPPAAAQARFNLMAGAGGSAKFLSLANPDSFTDEATRLAEPVGGWSVVDENTFEWESKYGMHVMHFNGYDSPAIEDPEAYPYLINKKQIENMIAQAGAPDAPIIYRMVLGWPIPVGMENTVLSTADLQAFDAEEKPEWRGSSSWLVKVAGLDPAFTAGGDVAMFQPAVVGVTTAGLFTIEFQPEIPLVISGSSKRPAVYQVVDQAVHHAMRLGIPVENIAVDSSGTQSVADIIAIETGRYPISCNFAAKAESSQTGEERQFANLVTEIWCNMAALVRRNRVRRFPRDAMAQFTSRRFKRCTRPLALESKAEYKKRTGQPSPDAGDGVALAGYAAFKVSGLAPGNNVMAGRGVLLRKESVDFENKYQNTVDFSQLSAYIGVE